jgi:hypothetical protein
MMEHGGLVLIICRVAEYRAPVVQLDRALASGGKGHHISTYRQYLYMRFFTAKAVARYEHYNNTATTWPEHA